LTCFDGVGFVGFSGEISSSDASSGKSPLACAGFSSAFLSSCFSASLAASSASFFSLAAAFLFRLI